MVNQNGHDIEYTDL